MRTKVVHLFIVAILLVLVLGLLQLQVLQGTSYRHLSKKNCIRLIPQAGSRGRILDRQGTVIVGNVLSYDVMILPQEAVELTHTLTSVSKIVDIRFDQLKHNFRENFVSSSIPVLIARNITIQKAIALEELKTDITGVVIQPHPMREYPFGPCASHVLGYLGEIDRWRLTKLEDYGYKTKDIVGFGGIEEKYDYFLRQEDGGTSVEVDRRGKSARIVGYRPPKSGRDIQLTIDIRAQKIAEDALGDKKGAVVIIDSQTGEILTMASSPQFNPAIFIAKDNAAINDVVTNKDTPLINRAMSAAYPPGSVFKPVVAACALETGKIDLATTQVCTGEIHLGQQKFGCWSTHGAQNVITALAHSCNVFFYRTGLQVGPQAISDYAVRFGLGKPTGIDLPYEEGGFIPNPLWKKIARFRSWFDGDTANLSIGQGDVLTTPLQIARMMAVFANKGKLIEPYLLKSIGGKDMSRYRRKESVVSLRHDTFELVCDGLRSVVTQPQGTGNVLSDLPVSVAGKTGTAQAPVDQSHAWFVGYFPYESGRYTICTFLEHGGPGHYACVVARQIIERIMQEGLLNG